MRSSILIILTIFAASTLAAEEKNDLYGQVEPILKESCYSCHGEKKQKGGLRLDSLDAIRKGGKKGPVVKPGDSAESSLFQRISLPADDEDIMPAKGDHLSADKIAAIGKWIDAMPAAAKP